MSAAARRRRLLSGSLPVLVLCLVVAAGCGRRAGEGEGGLESGEVPPPPDAGLVVEDAAPAAPAEIGGLAGVLPSDFPRDVPVPRPASVVDLGPGWVVLYTVDAVDTVRERLDTALRARGWTPSGDEGALRRYRSGERQLEVTVAPGPGGAQVRLAWAG